MKKLLLIIGCILFCVLGTFAQETITMPVSDFQQIRKLANEAAFQTNRANELEIQLNAWKTSSTKWKELYLVEKDRADTVQGSRINELKEANLNLTNALKQKDIALSEFEALSKADAQQIGKLQNQVNRLKSQRKWWFIAGAGLGGYVANKITVAVRF